MVAEISSKLIMLREKDTISKDDINDIANGISSMFQSCARDTFGIFKTNVKTAQLVEEK